MCENVLIIIVTTVGNKNALAIIVIIITTTQEVNDVCGISTTIYINIELYWN